MNYNAPIRVNYVAEAYGELRDRLSSSLGTNHSTRALPPKESVFATVGYPPRRARGKKAERLGAIIEYNWTGNPDEEAFLSVHPEQMKSGAACVQAVGEAMFRARFSGKWAKRCIRESITPTTVAAVVEKIGEPPPGYAVIPEPKKVDRCRLIKWTCSCVPPVIARIASTTKKPDITCNRCKSKFSEVKE